MPRTLLIVDDETAALRSVRRVLRTSGYSSVEICSNPTEVMSIVDSARIALVILDLSMPQRSGEDVLAELSRKHPDVPVIVVTAQAEVRTAVRCMKLGAIDYLLKPVDGEALLSTVAKALDASALKFEAARLREAFFDDENGSDTFFDEIITNDAKMARVFAYLRAIARGAQPVLIEGETGTGKELIARAIHRSMSVDGPFIAVNVAGLDDTMLSDTLFGHRRGAFTGADTDRPGMFEKAAGGVLFLDEIGDLSEASQVKLLRVIQEREFFPLGSDEPQPLLARIVAAIQPAARLRSDLYFRLRAYRVELPPLRHRLGDLPALVDHFLQEASQDLAKPKPTVTPELFVHLGTYAFPGNIRELRAMVFDAVARHGQGVIGIDPFVVAMDKDVEVTNARSDEVQFPFPMPSLENIQLGAIKEALRRVDGNQSAAARMLDVSRPTIARGRSRSKD